MIKLFIFGDSHSIVIRRALKLRAASDRRSKVARIVVERMEIVKTLDDGRTVTGGVAYADAIEALAAAPPDSVFISVIGGNIPNGFGMMQHPVRFDYFEPSRPDLPTDETATIIPVATLEEQFEALLRERDWKSIRTLREPFRGRAYLLAAPPPKEDNEFIARNAESQFKRRGIAEIGVSPPGLRLKLWHLQKRLMDEMCASIGMRPLAPPAAGLTPTGFLAPAYYGEDATHANADYGELVLEMAEQLVRAEEGVAG